MSEIFDLDALEREDTGDAFTFSVAGREITLLDPQEMDWQDLATLNGEDASQFFGAAIEDDDDADFFLDQAMPAWKLDKLMTAYLKHYGMPTPPKSGGSARRSNGSAKRRR